MLRFVLTAGLAIGSVSMLGCEKQAEQAPIEIVDDAPVLGVWFLQAAGDQPVAIDATIRFEFKPHGQAVYERKTGGPEAPDRYELTYNLTGGIISIDGDQDAPDVPRLTGQIKMSDAGQTLRINTHSDEDWLLTRAEKPGGVIEEARRFPQFDNAPDPRLVRVQALAYACNTYVERNGETPTRIFDLVEAGLVTPEQLTESGKAEDVPSRYERMTDEQRANWLETNSAFVFFFQYAGTGQSSSVVVSTLPDGNQSDVVVGMANGAVYVKPAKKAAKLLQFQLGKMPERWPAALWPRESTAGLEPLSD